MCEHIRYHRFRMNGRRYRYPFSLTCSRIIDIRHVISISRQILTRCICVNQHIILVYHTLLCIIINQPKIWIAYILGVFKMYGRVLLTSYHLFWLRFHTNRIMNKDRKINPRTLTSYLSTLSNTIVRSARIIYLHPNSIFTNQIAITHIRRFLT